MGAGVEGNAALTLPYPWRIEIVPFGTPISHVNWNTLAQGSTFFLGGHIDSSGAQNDEINWDVVVAAGTWDIEAMYQSGSSFGIISVQLDGVEVGTIDTYNATTVANNRATVTGVAVATSGKKRLKFKMATKNASSSSYNGRVQYVVLRRTA